jgi:prophage maintenance system killer protein
MDARELILQASREALLQGGPRECETVRDAGAIDWAADGIDSALAARNSIEEIAGVAFHRIVTGHPFVDCNHRTGSALALSLLAAEGFAPKVADKEIAEFAKSIDREGLGVGDVVAWITRSFQFKQGA